VKVGFPEISQEDQKGRRFEQGEISASGRDPLAINVNVAGRLGQARTPKILAF
jgi:hypothetical protein